MRRLLAFVGTVLCLAVLMGALVALEVMLHGT